MEPSRGIQIEVCWFEHCHFAPFKKHRMQRMVIDIERTYSWIKVVLRRFGSPYPKLLDVIHINTFQGRNCNLEDGRHWNRNSNKLVCSRLHLLDSLTVQTLLLYRQNPHVTSAWTSCWRSERPLNRDWPKGVCFIVSSEESNLKIYIIHDNQAFGVWRAFRNFGF